MPAFPSSTFVDTPAPPSSVPAATYIHPAFAPRTASTSKSIPKATPAEVAVVYKELAVVDSVTPATAPAPESTNITTTITTEAEAAAKEEIDEQVKKGREEAVAEATDMHIQQQAQQQLDKAEATMYSQMNMDEETVAFLIKQQQEASSQVIPKILATAGEEKATEALEETAAVVEAQVPLEVEEAVIDEGGTKHNPLSSPQIPPSSSSSISTALSGETVSKELQEIEIGRKKKRGDAAEENKAVMKAAVTGKKIKEIMRVPEDSLTETRRGVRRKKDDELSNDEDDEEPKKRGKKAKTDVEVEDTKKSPLKGKKIVDVAPSPVVLAVNKSKTKTKDVLAPPPRPVRGTKR